MTLPYDKFAAVVVLPTLADVQRPDLKRWLARGRTRDTERGATRLQRVLHALNLPVPAEGIAALRMWGQTGDRPTVWIAAADPVYLEPRLDHLRLHALEGDNLPNADLRFVFDALQARLVDADSSQSRYGFARIGQHGYVRADRPLVTSSQPATQIDGELPNEYMPSGDATGTYHQLRGEVEMALHDHDVNIRRAEQGRPPVNSLWLWGGGFAPEPQTEPRPPLFASDPLLRGYWASRTGVIESWPGSVEACLEASVAGFVAVPEWDSEPDVDVVLDDLIAALRRQRLSELVLLTEDGLEVRLRRADRWRIWQTAWPPEQQNHD